MLFDREEEYARLLSEFLRRQKELPWEIHTYTKMEELLEREKNGKVTMLVVAESSCMDTLSTLEPACQCMYGSPMAVPSASSKTPKEVSHTLLHGRTEP